MPDGPGAADLLLEARDLGYRVGGRDLVRGVALRVEAGSLQAVVGPNGAGKSTLLRLLCGELRPTRGQVAYAGEPVERIPPWRLAGLRAVLPQSARLAFSFSVAEVARIGLDGVGRRRDARAEAAILARALEQADVAHLAARAYQSLSGGEQARVQFARVLCQLAAGRTVAARQVLFLDEPTASLDLRHQCAVLDAAADLARQGAGVVAILHDLNLAAAYAGTLLVLHEGRLVEQGPPGRVLRDDVIASVFGVRWRVGWTPGPGQPFLLPQPGVAAAPRPPPE
ncbi:Hemin import ATP-binding protein HmuV [Methylobacterium crusticola]|uniref:Hemin import ATP-binding protein HmuV n=1 Tax=Methylobacterium crusticola TaxID=1697972 RepID=A0ABQ4QV54_9HYPH|nr:heme ABC transporter ATP-binding protein [Methylobacterium crusticola]GJD49173.1 Hemin import ATP-binding protein HmuV [Methylobacterium crusticola]